MRIHLPLTKDYFNIICYFMKGNLQKAIQQNWNLADAWNGILEEYSTDQEAMGEAGDIYGPKSRIVQKIVLPE